MVTPLTMKMCGFRASEAGAADETYLLHKFLFSLPPPHNYRAAAVDYWTALELQTRLPWDVS